jgi:hypothetical protein
MLGRVIIRTIVIHIAVLFFTVAGGVTVEVDAGTDNCTLFRHELSFSARSSLSAEMITYPTVAEIPSQRHAEPQYSLR